MGKIIIVIGVIISLGASLTIFFTRSSSTLEDQFEQNLDSEPRVVIDDFNVYRYDGHKVISSFSAKLGHFLEPNIVEVYAGIRGTRYRKDSVESIRSEVAKAYLKANSLSDILGKNEPELMKAEVEDQVRLGLRDNIMRTEYAEYLADKEVLTTREPVQVDGPNRTFVGEDGFDYDMRKEVLNMPGEVKGVVVPDRK